MEKRIKPLTKKEIEALERGGFNSGDEHHYHNQTRVVQLERWLKYKPAYAVKAVTDYLLHERLCNAQTSFEFKFYWAMCMNKSDIEMLRYNEDDKRNFWIKKTIEDGLCGLEEVIDDLE
ncbi:MAG: hypothetical protein ABIF40_05410 [archaeon]